MENDHRREHDTNRYREARRKGLCVHHGCKRKAVKTIYCEEHRKYHVAACKKSYFKIKKRNYFRSLVNDPATITLGNHFTCGTA